MVYELKTEYGDRGYVVEYLASNTSEYCKSWLLLPAENLWPEWLRGILYLICMFYFFLGVAISSDIFMNSIEVLTSKKRTVKQWDPEKNEMKEVEVFIWNETVANLTLMALGSSAPEILLATFESIGSLGVDNSDKDSLGTFTIIGSAAFNLLIITSVCVVSVSGDEPKAIKEFGVFLLTSAWSLWAYIWLLLVVQYISPGVVDPWEAWVTLLYMPVFVFLAYATDNGWWRHKCCIKKNEVDAQEPKQMDHIRIMTHVTRRGSFAGHATAGKELHMLELEKQQKLSVLSLNSLDKKSRSDDHLHPYGNDRQQSISPGLKSAKDINVSIDSDSHEKDHDQTNAEDRLVKMEKGSKEPQQSFARARFRHAVVSAMTGTKKRVGSGHKSARFAELVKQVQNINQASKEGKMPAGDLYGKFTFASDRYAVLESAGKLTIDVLFHRNMPKAGMKAQAMNGDMMTFKNGSTQVTSIPATANPASKHTMEQVFEGTVTVEFETREGSGKAGKDFKYQTGSLTFKDTEYRQSITIDIINDNQFENDCDFYVILKNTTNGTSLGDPSVTRITIVDDDEPGEFQFEAPHVYADLSSGKVKINVLREHGVDGKVTMEYSTIDGTAIGGSSLSKDVDYIQSSGTLEFKHQETYKTIEIKINKEAKCLPSMGSKNFVIALKNPSLGAKIGRSAVVCHINKESIEDRIAEVIKEEEEDEPVTWPGQFRNAMSIEGGQDEDGNDVPPTFMDYLLHFLTFFWKLIGAMVPPTTMLGAWPSFVFSLVYIALLTLVIEQLGHLLGCVVGLKTSVTGITIIALGTSLPDTFASRTAAIQDEYADAAIGNVTGSNSVNVFLGLGLPWVLSSMYAYATGKEYKVPSGNLTQSVIIFSTLGALCIVLLVIRRKYVGGELGGKNPFIKWGSSITLFLMWVIYIVLASLKAYDILDWEV
ncbi:sodium/calcium exchanger 3-like isoform X5 [Crassostrea virginica]